MYLDLQAGKTARSMEAKNGEADIVIVAACGERAGEVRRNLKRVPGTGRPEDWKISDGENHHYL